MKLYTHSLRIVTMAALLAACTECGGQTVRVIEGAPVSLPAPGGPPEVRAVGGTVTASPHPTATAWVPVVPSPRARHDLSPLETPTPAEARAAAPVPIGQLDEGMAGQQVTVEGTVAGTASFSAGFRFVLEDASGMVTLLMWHDSYDRCADAPALNLGAQVVVTGLLGVYEGRLQIVPTWGGAVRVLEPADMSGEPHAIASLAAADVGQRVLIEGTVVRRAVHSSGSTIYVSDGTAEIAVYVWHSILERVPGGDGLAMEGSRLRVAGDLALYDGILEVVPVLPYDVKVLETP